MRYALVWMIFAGGCVFRVNPDYVAPSPDLAMGEDRDLTAAPQPSAPVDLGGAAPSPTPDLLSPCTRVTEPFAADPSATWTISGDASFDATRGGLQLTSLALNVAGGAFFDVALPAAELDATFDFHMGDGSGADGLAFVIAKAASVGGQGYGLGYLGMSGIAVEFDTFMNLGNGDPNANHVALVRTSDGTHLLTGTPSVSLRSAGSHTAHVRVAAGHLAVEVDGAKTIDSDLPKGVALPSDPQFFGFTAASSALTDRHVVSKLTLIVGPAGTCF